jgi:hypothetical protein
MEIRVPAAPRDAPADTIAIAGECGLPLWCDDIALRQQARHCGVPAFSLLDLATELTRQGTPLSIRSVLRRLASHYVVDLPLDADDLIEIAAADGWHPGPAHTALTRPAWWQAQEADWPGTWLPVAAEARKHSAVAFLDITKAALTGALNSVSGGYRTMRYQELVVTALTACHVAGTTAPLGAARSPRGLRPRSLPGPPGGTAPAVRAQGTRTRAHPAIGRASPGESPRDPPGRQRCVHLTIPASPALAWRKPKPATPALRPGSPRTWSRRSRTSERVQCAALKQKPSCTAQ